MRAGLQSRPEMSFKPCSGHARPRRRVLCVASKSAGSADPSLELLAPIQRHPADSVDNGLHAAAVNEPQRPAEPNIIGGTQCTLSQGEPPAREPMRVEKTLVKAVPICDCLHIARVQPLR